MKATTLYVAHTIFLVPAACSSNNGSCPGGGDSQGRTDLKAGDREGDLDTTQDSRAYVSRGFRYNPAVCAADGSPASAAVTGVDVTVELLDVVEGPDVTIAEVESPEEIVDPGGWQGGEYLVALTPSGDVMFAAENGILGIASWCEADSLGQIRRLDYGLADAVTLWSSLAGWDYVAETKAWVFPSTVYTKEAGSYQRTYMNQSLSLPETHSGQLSVSGLPEMAGFALFGHADAPSPHGAQVGVELLQVGQTKLVETYTEIVHELATLVWDAPPLVGEGDNPVTVDLMLASERWESLETGFYTFFADAVFPANLNGSLVVSLQGAPPGKLLASKSIDELEMPPLDGL